MGTENDVFEKLVSAHGEYVSGEQLADSLHVSRAAVWKAIRSLREAGYDIASKKHVGYSLTLPDPGDLPAVDAESLEELCAERGVRFIKLESIPSTNTYALGLPADGGRPTLIITDAQTDGKARHGKGFPSPKDRGLYMTYLVHPAVREVSLHRLTILSAELTARAVGGTAAEQEVYADGRKVAGVLAESTSDTDGVTAVAIGIGIYTDRTQKQNGQIVAKILDGLQAMCEKLFGQKPER